ncbi:hypothetical protein ACMHYB_30155 [Sorangium sp. So ce1128]
MRLETDERPPSVEVFLVFHRDAKKTPRVRVVVRELATSRYVQWAVLMKRTFGFDALRCPRCERKMRVLSTITDPKAVRRILDHLNLPSHPTAAAPARDPTWEPMAFGFDAA